MNITTAYRQWQNRPTDERYWGLHDMAQAAYTLRESSREQTVPEPLVIANDGDDIFLANTGQRPTHYAFGQIARLAGAPAEYMRQLPPDLIAACLNDGLDKRAGSGLQLLTNTSIGEPIVRAVTSESYSRIWHADLLQMVAQRVSPDSWRTPPCRPAFTDSRSRPMVASDMHPASRMKLGETIAPGGAYMSDRDLFLFMVSTTREIASGLFRAIIVENSEVGAGAAKFSFFLLNSVCGNHIMWDAKELGKIKVVHRGENAGYRFARGLSHSTQAYSDMGNYEDSYIGRAITTSLGETEQKVIETTAKRCGISLSQATAGFAAADLHRADHGSTPDTAWGMVNGLTRYSQTLLYQGDRVALDRAAGRLMVN